MHSPSFLPTTQIDAEQPQTEAPHAAAPETPALAVCASMTDSKSRASAAMEQNPDAARYSKLLSEFNQWAGKIRPEIVQRAKNRLRIEEGAEDIVQAVLFRLWHRTLREGELPNMPYVLASINNECSSWFGNAWNKKILPISTLTGDDPTNSPTELLERLVARNDNLQSGSLSDDPAMNAEWNDLLSTLPKDEFRYIQLYFLYRLNLKETADTMRISPQTARKIGASALRHLHGCL